jgi:hypothetical protein
VHFVNKKGVFPMAENEKLNLKKFLDCLVSYRNNCLKTVWTKRQLHKFYFANLLCRRVQLKFQSAEMIYEICKRIKEKDFYYKNPASEIDELQFLKKEASKNKHDLLTITKIQLFKELAIKDDWHVTDFNNKNVNLLELTGWLGTLLPEKFMPVNSRQFRHTIAYFFDLELKIYRESDYEFLVNSQKYFKLTKEKIKEFDMDCLFLREIAEYIRYKHPKAVLKKQYEEYDWNWITHDFHLYVYKEILKMDSFSGTLPVNKIQKRINCNAPR